MPTGRPKCPICQGKGTLTENTQEYEFITRDPITAKCMVCNGEGWLNPSTRLPNGKRVFEVFRKDNGTQKTGSTGSAGSGKRLNVSKKAVINPEAVDTGVGYQPGVDGMDDMDKVDGAAAETGHCHPEKRRGRPKKAEGKEGNALIIPSYLRKVLESGKRFLVITESDPYYLVVCMEIRKLQIKREAWSAYDEEGYIKALEDAVLRQMEVSNG